MEIYIIPIVACFASLLTFFSGFGLGTILTPVFIVFFPVEEAIALTGVVHFLNNLFKVSLTLKNADREIVLRFGLPAIVAAYLGAKCLILLGKVEPLYSYYIQGRQFFVSPLKLVIAVTMIFFALFEVIPVLKKLEFSKNKLIAGGLLSGFFGGLSGNQGALRSAFLLRYKLSKETFIATGILIACFIDVTRLSVYISQMQNINWYDNQWLLIITILFAFIGAYFGNKLLKKVTFSFVQNMVSIMVLIIAVLLGLGVL